MSDFEDRASAAGRGLRGLDMTNNIDPGVPKRRLQRRRRAVAAASAVVVVVGVGIGVAVTRDGDTVHVLTRPSTTDIAGPTTTVLLNSTSTPMPSTTAPSTTTPIAVTVPRALVTVRGGRQVILLDGADETDVFTEDGVEQAYHLAAGQIVVTQQGVNVVIARPRTFGLPQTLPDMQLMDVGVYHGHNVVLTVDLHNDVLHNNWRWISLFDLSTWKLTRTKLSIAPGTTLDHVSIAGDLFVMSGVSDEGGPFVLYRHIDNSFDTTLPNPVAGNLAAGPIANAVISPDGTRLAYLENARDLVVTDVKSGTLLTRVRISDETYFPGDAVDFDGRWAVVTRGDARAVPAGTPGPPAVLVDTTAAHPAAIDIMAATGPTTLDRV